MKILKILLLCALIVGLNLSCGSAKSEKNNELKNKQYIKLIELVESKSFSFHAESAYPTQTFAVMQVTNALLRNTGNAAGRIYIAGNSDYIKVMQDSVSAELSYFGELRVVSSTDPRDTGIKFKGESLNFKITKNNKKRRLNIEFDVKSRSDRYNVNMQVYPSKRASIFLSSMNRTSIRYDGEIKELIRPGMSSQIENQEDD
ncbi:MAG: DUF4251 domain-containing protein [Bacteroidia bacterium]|nr:DUF4251 domain-containing protein [Bacteroidia bacterium]